MYNELDFQLYDAWRRAGRAMRANQTKRGERHGPSSKREIILAILSDHEGGMRQNQLAEAFCVSPSTLSEMLNRLEKDGFIRRTPDPSDRRATLLSLTDKGTERVSQIKQAYLKAFSENFSALNDEDKRQLIALLMKLANSEARN